MTFWPNEAMRQAALFEQEFEALRAELVAVGRVPPSREAILDTARRQLAYDARGVIGYVRTYRKLPTVA